MVEISKNVSIIDDQFFKFPKDFHGFKRKCQTFTVNGHKRSVPIPLRVRPFDKPIATGNIGGFFFFL